MKLNEQLQKWAARGADGIAGSLITLTVGDVEGLTLHQIRSAFLSRPEIAAWAPAAPNMVSLYLSTIGALGRSTDLARKFVPNSWGEFEVDPETHRAYVVTRMHLDKESDVPTAHKVLHLVKDVGADGRIDNIEADEGIQIHLRREYGDKDTDASGDSQFEFEIYSNDGDRISAAENPRYLPFLRTLEKVFDERCSEQYGSAQVRTMLMDVFHNMLNVIPVNRAGLYFVEAERFNQVQALADAMRELNPNILIYNAVVPLYEGDDGPTSTVSLVSEATAEYLQSEMTALIDDLRAMGENPSTRPSTWDKRTQQFLDLSKRMRALNRIHLRNVDVLQTQYSVARGLILTRAQAE